MDPVIAIALWATLFVASHIVISSDAVRPGLIRAIGPLPYRGLSHWWRSSPSRRWSWPSPIIRTPVRCSGICAASSRFDGWCGC